MGSEEDIKKATERLRKENEEKIRKMKERNENREKEEAERKEKDTQEKREKYSREFQKKPLNVEKVNPKEYTAQMRDEDLDYLDGWMQYEFGRFEWMMSELGIETERRTKMATSAKDLQEIRDWHYEQIKQTHKYLDGKKKEIWDLKDRVMKAFLYKEDPKDKKEKEAEQKFGLLMRNLLGKVSSYDFKNFKDPNWQRKADEYQKNILILSKTGSYQDKIYSSWKERLEILQKLGIDIEDFLIKAEEAKKKKPGNGGGQTGPETPPGGTEGKKAEQIAIQELGITYPEYKNITGNIDLLSGTELTDLVKKVFKTDSIDKKGVKKAYYRCVKKWHPDVNGSNGKKEVCEIKVKVANNLYGEYNKRFGK
jgi:hypothetical protein